MILLFLHIFDMLCVSMQCSKRLRIHGFAASPICKICSAHMSSSPAAFPLFDYLIGNFISSNIGFLFGKGIIVGQDFYSFPRFPTAVSHVCFFYELLPGLSSMFRNIVHQLLPKLCYYL